ncbi:PEP-CTERM sorting domain-containing protein [Verrucomicrobiaceae bacterium R5-34]|uniref:PEP-CTERM sorting domain-containing protein n=1 Tax=Oceaniferula flava TaxID=2800421 RepID=A0AAE2SCA2_9BACT|nr:PEP-CTERM sorting domain-containing protein [Oceaniferula flavus]MBK1829984.1 PEP-CTERM sorting domain-containing protein [Verrucomicrobiaceae bacterium R5-34]MBK1855169.1 PEP-CTERM sorting domain-containing protein [Oceaniferula flavus]MBM1136475.1 PEP-CTERM sorting domain-containing protein [Oceaniferula flavus]
MKLIGTSVITAMIAASSTIGAAVVTFDLTNNEGDNFDFNAPTGSYTHVTSGFTGDFTAIVAGSTGNLNAQSTSFGVNAENGFIPDNPSDNTGQLDADQGAESFTIQFSGPVIATLTQIDISSFGGSDAGTLDIGGNTTAIASGSSTLIPAHTNLVGETLTIAFTAGTAGNGFSVDTLTFDVQPIPEPSTTALLGLGGLALLMRRRK